MSYSFLIFKVKECRFKNDTEDPLVKGWERYWVSELWGLKEAFWEDMFGAIGAFWSLSFEKFKKRKKASNFKLSEKEVIKVEKTGSFYNGGVVTLGTSNSLFIFENFNNQKNY